MNRPLLSLLSALSLGFALPASADESIPGPRPGDAFPSLTAQDQAGQTRSLAELAGEKGLVVAFVRSADWCPFCQRQLVDLNQRLAEFQNLGLAVVSISVDEVAEIESFASEQNIAYTMLADPAGDINQGLGIRDEQYPVGSAAFGVPRPIIYILDSKATIRAVYMEPTYRTRPDLDVVLSDTAKLGL